MEIRVGFERQQNWIIEDSKAAHIAQLDPLGYDCLAWEVKELNEQEDLQGLVVILDRTRPSLEALGTMSIEEKVAAMRDLGMVISSIRKLGEEPTRLRSELNEVLLSLGRQTNMPPRDTAYHYGPWNPDGERQRTFTKLKDERGLIHGVRVAIPACEKAIFSLLQLRQLKVTGSEFQVVCEKIQHQLKKAVNGIVYSVRTIDPWIFSHKLRPYFDPITIDGKHYIGPGGGQMPLYVFDKLLWYDMSNRHYNEFIDESNDYMPLQIKETFLRAKKSKPLTQLLLTDLEALNLSDNKQVQLNLKEFDMLFKLLFKFRKPHENLAKRSLSKENQGNYDTGSAGYKYSLVQEIYEINSTAYRRFKKSVT
jgi:hypothetical protein